MNVAVYFLTVIKKLQTHKQVRANNSRSKLLEVLFILPSVLSTEYFGAQEVVEEAIDL